MYDSMYDNNHGKQEKTEEKGIGYLKRDLANTNQLSSNLRNKN